ncbi:hypothetical protein QCM11_41 [Bacillus phage QCM11]|uniref:Uncharacterized protein n=1 Tax=Bacillus phage QCM11 TaxID=1909400 RepID=A0A1I9S6Q6_9CAUD|nr:hypothetical protein H3008_gp41 [Bacillus phage QCM11]AOZ62250.1 hypothetical protein QCM11_41 [Bacillus phage QCM11]
MTKKDIIIAIKESYASSELRTRKNKGTEEVEVMASRAYGVFNRYSDSTINSMYTKEDLMNILLFVQSYKNEEVMIQTEEESEIEYDEEIISSVEANELFNYASDLFTNVELVDEESIVIEDSIKPIQITHDKDWYLLEINNTSLGYVKLDEIKSILKNLSEPESELNELLFIHFYVNPFMKK